jgi:hypothetical protein
MNNRAACIGLILLATVFTGCLPETRVWWSPDGKFALVRGGDGLRLCDAEGKLSLPIAENVPAAAWMPDSRQFIAVWAKTVVTWEELLPYLSAERQAAAKAMAEDFRRQVLAYRGEWDKFQFDAKPADIMAALMCLRDQFGQDLAPKVGPPWEALKGATHTVHVVQLFEVADGEARPGKRLLESLEPIAELRVAPTGNAFAYAAPPYPPTSAEPTFSLFAASMAAPDKPRLVQHRVSIFFDWTPDGRSLVYADAEAAEPRNMPMIGIGSAEQAVVYLRGRMRDPEQQPSVRVGSLSKREVAGADGAPVEGTSEAALAKVPFFDSLPVRCLRSGRVLFASRDVHLPAAPADVPRDFTLFSWDPADPKVFRKVLAPETEKLVGGLLHLFQLSPDETRVAVPVREGLVAVVDLASGKVTKVSDAPMAGRPVMIPVWRSNEELCFTAPAGSKLASPGAAEVVLWSPAGSRCLSKDWPDSVAKGFLQRKAP